MQNKGIVIVTAVLLTLASLFYLSFSFVSSRMEKKAGEQKTKADSLEYLENTKYLGIYSYQKCLETQVGLGLDLKGGMNVMLEVDVPEMVNSLSNNSQDADFVKALTAAKEEWAKDESEDFINLLDKHYNKQLAGIFASQISELGPNSSDAEVIKVLHQKMDETIEDARNVIVNRIDRFGVVQPNIQIVDGRRIMVEMPGVKDPERMRKLLQGSANLEFWETYPSDQIAPKLYELNNKLKALEANNAEPQKEEADKTENTEKSDTLPKKDESTLQQVEGQGPLLSKVFGGNLIADKGCIVLMALDTDIPVIDSLLHTPEANILPDDLKLLWGAKPTDNPNIDQKVRKHLYELYAIRETNLAIKGDVVTNAKDEFDQLNGNRAIVTMQMNTKGANAWAKLTGENVGKPVAIVLDNLVYSAPNVMTKITGGNTQISGNFTVEDTKDLANTLKSGRMKVPVKIVNEEVVGPSLGAQSIRQGIISFIVAFILLMIYMVLMYGFIPGMMANSALIINLFFTMGIMASFQSALTMPGIAGIVLTLGMAVDANVLIYERTREELRKGQNVRQALASGYSNAFSAIFDSNLTSIITGVILLMIGTGPVKGFAVTLIIGICCSFFTAVFLTRLVYEFMHKRDKWLNLTFSTPLSRNLMQNTHFNFMGNYKKSYLLWSIAALIFIGFFIVRGLSLSIDFTGGRNYQMNFEKAVQPEDITKVLQDEFKDEATVSCIALGTDNKTIRVSTNYKIAKDSQVAAEYKKEYGDSITVDEETEIRLYNALKKANMVSQKDFNEFQDRDNPKGAIKSNTTVGPSIARDVTQKAIISVIVALIAIFLYILLRFRNVAFSIGSIVALAFDTLIVIGFFSALWAIVPFSLEVNQTFIGAILTVIGYSINDKVVVFDRVRENLNLYKKRDLQQLFNDSLNQTLARTVNTSVSTLIVLLCIFFLGGDSIRGFSFALILGVIFGTLSSLFIAAPTAYLTMGRSIKKADADDAKNKAEETVKA